ncbi:hypothetical protein L873DRAFT_1569662, partial [Choiromyces venosus 120613-1]
WFNVYMDNYFTNVSLSQVLHNISISTCGTAWQNRNAFPPELHNGKTKPHTTSTNTATCRAFRAGHEHQVFPTPKVIDNYNHNMNIVDRTNQLHVLYHTQLKAQQNWLPIFYWLSDTSIVNSFIL